MNAGPATYPAPLAASSARNAAASPPNAAAFARSAATGQGLDPVRSRVVVRQQLTNDQMLQANAAAQPVQTIPHALLPDTRSGGPRGPHPGDIIYWIACLGGVCLLLLCATT